MNILVTGGAGFIGRNLIDRLMKNSSNKITILDNLSTQIHGEDSIKYVSQLQQKCNFIQGDVRNKTDWMKALNGNDIVYHLAAETGTGQSMYEVDKYVSTNVSGTSILLDLIANQKVKIKKLILASSRSVYGEGRYRCSKHGIVFPPERTEDIIKKGLFEPICLACNEILTSIPTTEDSKVDPVSIYAATKYMQEELCLIITKSLNIPLYIFRFQNVYGPGQSLNNPYTGILSIFSNLIQKDKEINIFEDGLESRDFVYIDDIVDALILPLSRKEVIHDIFNVGSGRNLTVIEIVKELYRCYQKNENYYISGDFRKGDIRHNFADLEKIRKSLGYEPKISFEVGITKFVNWVRMNKLNDIDYDGSLNEMKVKGMMIEKE